MTSKYWTLHTSRSYLVTYYNIGRKIQSQNHTRTLSGCDKCCMLPTKSTTKRHLNNSLQQFNTTDQQKTFFLQKYNRYFMKFISAALHNNKVTIHPGFSGTVLIFNDVSWKKITVLPGRPFVPFLAWCPGFVLICPSPQPSTYALMAKKLAQILSVYTKISLTAWGSAPDPAGELTKLPRLHVGPLMVCACGARTLRYLHLQCSSQIVVPKLWSP